MICEDDEKKNRIDWEKITAAAAVITAAFGAVTAVAEAIKTVAETWEAAKKELSEKHESKDCGET